MLNCLQVFTINSSKIQFWGGFNFSPLLPHEVHKTRDTWFLLREAEERQREKLPEALWVLLTGLTEKFKEMCLFYTDNIYFFVNFNIILRNMNFYNPLNSCKEERQLEMPPFFFGHGVKIRRLFIFNIKLLILTWFLRGSCALVM